MNPVPLPAWGPRGVSPERRSQPGNTPDPLPAHPGLWIDRMVASPWSEEEKGWAARSQLYKTVVGALTPASRADQDPPALKTYLPLFRRWREAVTSALPGSYRRVVELEAVSRLLLHPASNESVTEGSLLLHHTYGVPYLPGSALKGVTRARLLATTRAEQDPKRKSQLTAWAEDLLGFVKEGKAAQRSRGEPSTPKTQASFVEFLDALWMPPEGSLRGPEVRSPLALDVVTPHHPEYYTVSRGVRKRPTDYDNPIPVERLTVAPGTRFLLVVETAQDLSSWLDWLMDSVFLPALQQEGLGAWTSAGYGRLLARRSQGRKTPLPSEWQGAQVIWVPGKGELQAVLPGDRRAFALGPSAEELLTTLPDEKRDALTKRRKREAWLEVQVVEEGASWRILALRPLDES